MQFILGVASVARGAAKVWAYIDDVSVSGIGPTYIDSGLRIWNGSQPIAIAAWPLGEEVKSPLRISRGNNTYGIVLIDPSDPEYGDPNFDSGVRIQTSSGIKALRKYSP